MSRNSPEQVIKNEPLQDQKLSAVVISHRRDADGICAATLVHHLTGAKVLLADYVEILETLSLVQPAEEVFICDLGLNPNIFDQFLARVRKLASTCTVHYIDHHPLDQGFASQLREAGIDLCNSPEECASVLVYRKFEDRLSSSPNMKVLACCGAITDYMDLQPIARKLISSFDRQFLLYEATVLSFSIAMIGKKGVAGNPLLVQMIEQLSGRGPGPDAKEGKLPHEIENAASYAQAFASSSAALIKQARREGVRMKNFAYMKTNESATGNVANFLIGAFDVPVGMALREDGPDYYEISLRSTEESNHDLGKTVSQISSRIHASGGGHFHAAGSRIQKNQLEGFIEALDQALSQ